MTYTTLHTTPNALYALGISKYHSSPSSSSTFVIQVVSISPYTGQTISHAVVPSHIASPSSYLVVSSQPLVPSSPSSPQSSTPGSSSGSIQSKLREALKAAKEGGGKDNSFTKANTRLIWLDAEESILKSLPLTPTLDGKGSTIKGEEFTGFIDIGLASFTDRTIVSELKETSMLSPKFLAVRKDGAARILALDNDGGVKGDVVLGDTASFLQ